VAGMSRPRRSPRPTRPRPVVRPTRPTPPGTVRHRPAPSARGSGPRPPSRPASTRRQPQGSGDPGQDRRYWDMRATCGRDVPTAAITAPDRPWWTGRPDRRPPAPSGPSPGSTPRPSSRPRPRGRRRAQGSGDQEQDHRYRDMTAVRGRDVPTAAITAATRRTAATTAPDARTPVGPAGPTDTARHRPAPSARRSGPRPPSRPASRDGTPTVRRHRARSSASGHEPPLARMSRSR
jgi:hypothetical protein